MHSDTDFHQFGNAVGLRHQCGQSLVEMFIALIALVPMAAGVMLLGQYMHIKLQTQAAARAAAWAATDDPALANGGLPAKAVEEIRLRRRQFANAGQTLRSDGETPAHFSDAMLTTFAGKSLLKPADLTLDVYKQGASPSYVDKAVGAIGGQLSRFGLSNTLPPNKRGLVSAEVHANTDKILGTSGVPLTFLSTLADRRLDFSARTVLLADAWDAAGGGEGLDGKGTGAGHFNRTVRGVVRPLAPSTWLSGSVGNIIFNSIHILGQVPIVNDLITPGWKYFEPGRTAPDVVPEDKLVRYKNVH